MEQEIAAQVVGLGGSSDFSLLKLFLRADFVVKFVIILLIASSIFSWALIFDKFKLFKSINASTEDFEKKFWKAKSAESFNNSLSSKSNDPITLIFKDAMNELLKTKSKVLAIDLDNTLWGGIIGEDGLAGIKLGKTYPGSAYYEFQEEIINLYNKGIIITICSKNNERIVQEETK